MADSEEFTPKDLAELLMETGHHHHQAYISADGVDPEWALWYSGYLQSRMWDRAGVIPTRSRLIQLLLNAEESYNASGSSDPWPPIYAAQMLAALNG